MIDFNLIELLDIKHVLKSKVIENKKYLETAKTKAVIETLAEINSKYEKLIKKIDDYVEQ